MKADYNLKKIQDFERAIALAKEFSGHEKWTQQEVFHFQNEKLNYLVRYAVHKSPLYKELYKYINIDEPIILEKLPVINKEIMMENFDDVVTDPRLKIADLYTYLERLKHDDYFLGKYRVLSTAGSSGLKGIFVFDREAWSTILACVKRASAMMEFGPKRHTRISSIGADSPLHLSYRRAISMDFGLFHYQRLNATERIENIVKKLNDFQPEYLHTYSSIASLLAIEQIEGRLDINPHVIITGAEVLTEDMREKIRKAWGFYPFNAYSATEGVLGIECSHHHGIHLFEDLCIVEIVDEQNRPVPAGTPGYKILLTNLFQFVQPIIRYEISDMVTVSDEQCTCGRPFRLITSIDGRNDDIIRLPGIQGGQVPLLPILFRSPVAAISNVREYQVIHKRDGIHIHLALRKDAQTGEKRSNVKNELKKILEEKIASLHAKCPKIYITFMERIYRDPKHMGKIKLVREDV